MTTCHGSKLTLLVHSSNTPFKGNLVWHRRGFLSSLLIIACLGKVLWDIFVVRAASEIGLDTTEIKIAEL